MSLSATTVRLGEPDSISPGHALAASGVRIPMPSLFGHAGRFRRDRRGNIAVMFAIVLIPMLAAVGGAVDYSLANAQRSRIQAALDSAILAGAIAGKQSLDSGSGQSTAIA